VAESEAIQLTRAVNHHHAASGCQHVAIWVVKHPVYVSAQPYTVIHIMTPTQQNVTARSLHQSLRHFSGKLALFLKKFLRPKRVG